MKIIEIRTIEGPNVYCYRPVIKFKVDLENFTDVSTKEIPGFVEKLVHYMPSLRDHHCSRRRPGGFIERLNEGTYLGHVIEHVALELQCLAGCDVVYGKTLRTETPGLYNVITEYESKEGALQACLSAVKFVRSLLENKYPNLEKEIARIKEQIVKTGLGPSTAAIAREALKRGIPVMRLGEESVLQLGYGKYQQRIAATITSRTKCVAVDIACNKVLVKHLLAEAGIPVPWGGVAVTEEEALDLACQIGGPVVIKPFDGNQGKGITLNLQSKHEIKRGFRLARSFSPRVVVEEFIEGKHYRLLVVGDRVVAAAEKIPAFVIGDGARSIKQLVDIVNKDPLRGEGHEKPLTKIKFDSEVIMVLGKRGLSPESVPAQDEVVYLRENANLSTGGIAVDVTDRVHPQVIETAIRAVRLVGLDVAGVDMVAKAIDRPLLQENGALIEINAAPGIRMHHYPARGQARNVAAAIVETLFPPGSKSRIPIISVTGTNGKTTVTRMLSHILRKKGLVVGATTSDGIYINERKIVSGDTTGPRSAGVVLRDPSVEVAVLETARGGILRSGLGYDYSDVGIITNISNDHLGIDGIETLEDMAYVKAVVAEAVHRNGFTVLNADDRHVVQIARLIKSGVIYFSIASDNIIVRRHLGVGGTAVFIKNGFLVVACGEKTKKVLPIKRIPCTFGGLAQHNVQNTLAAAAGCIALGIELEDIRKGMLDFNSDENFNPGRFNIFEMGCFRVVVDYGHNEAGYLNTLQTIKKLRPQRIIGVVGMPGDRKNEDIARVGKVVSKYCHYVIVKEDSNLRGRKAGEVAEVIREAVLEAGTGAEQVEVILPELTAVERGLSIAETHDVVVIFYEKLEPILNLLKEVRRNSARGLPAENRQLACPSTC